jgi:formylglycine-generating enzyme required for sulfatase activity
MKSKALFTLCGVGILSCFVFLAGAQEVSIPDPGLNAAIREALQKSSGPLTEQDLLSLTNLSAGGRSISSVQGLEVARNLRILDLDNNSITNFSFAGALTNLTILDLFNNHLTSFVLSNALPDLKILDIGFNSLVQCSIPGELTNLDTLFLEGNNLTNFNLPAGLTALTQLDLSGNKLTSFTLPGELTNMVTLLVFANQLTNATLPANLARLAHLDLDFNKLRNFSAPSGLTNLNSLTLLANQLTNLALRSDMTQLSFFDAGANQLSNFTLPAELTRLSSLHLNANQLTSFALPPGLTNLNFLALSGNQLTNLSLPSDLSRLAQVDLGENNLASFTLPSGMTNLVDLTLDGNQLTNVVLPADVTRLVSFFVNGNPLATFVLSEPLAATNLAGTVESLRSRGVSVFTYPSAVQLLLSRALVEVFQFGITGPPGAYAVLGSADLAAWSQVGVASNQVGSVSFTDGTAQLSPRRFYQARPLLPPTNMVFIPPNTFTMGSSTNDLDHASDEVPKTTVTLTRGFWIGKFEVTQGEYLSVMHTNPSSFPGDLTRPVSSVSWFDATNYCWKLTQRELAAGRIPPGSQYRLPTEAEWECAARAGTTTRFSYGDDPDYTNLTNYAWFILNSGFPSSLTLHPVGQKLPNPWGLYDTEGNVWEWTQDWLGGLPGGTVADPQGPSSNPMGRKVVRGGSYDFDAPDCRSARRFFSVGDDTDIGFRVVLVIGTQ